MYTHDSQFTFGIEMAFDATQREELARREPPLFGADLDFAWARGGALTRAFLAALPDEWIADPDTILDTRSHMLFPGWLPCIPGWHHDDVRRGPDGQPDYKNPGNAEHVMATVNGAICPTLLLKPGLVTIPETPPGQIVYGHLHPLIEELSKQRGTVEMPDATPCFFNWQTWHTGQAAREQGWRWFARASRKTDRKHRDEVRTQVNVYVPIGNLYGGW